MAIWIEKLGQFDFEIKQEIGKKIPHLDCMLQVPQTEDEAKDCNQVNQVNTNDENIRTIGLEKNVEQLVEHHKNEAQLIIQQTWVESRKRPQWKNIAGAL